MGGREKKEQDKKKKDQEKTEVIEIKERLKGMKPIKKEYQTSFPSKKAALRHYLKGWKQLKEKAKEEGDKKLLKRSEKGIKDTKRELEKTT